MIPCYVDKIYIKSNLPMENHRVQDAYHLQIAEDPYHHRSFNWFGEPKPIFKWFQRSACVKLCNSPLGITACCFDGSALSSTCILVASSILKKDYILLFYIKLNYITLSYVILCYIKLHYNISYHIISHYVILC